MRRTVLADLQQRSVLRDDRGQSVARGLGVVEVALRVGLQAHRELVEMLGDLMIAVEALIEVGLAVAVVIMEADDLVAATDVNLAGDDLEAQRLEQPRGDPLPREALGRLDRVRRPARHRRPRCRRPHDGRPGRKSKPESRIWQSQGLLFGSVRTSTANGPSSRPIDGPEFSGFPATAVGRRG